MLMRNLSKKTCAINRLSTLAFIHPNAKETSRSDKVANWLLTREVTVVKTPTAVTRVTSQSESLGN